MLVRSWVVAPLLHTYANGAVPPVTVRSIDPVEVPLQLAFTCVSVNTIAAGSVITIPFRVCVHPPASVSVTLYVPAGILAVSYTHLRAHETGRNLVCRLLLEK